MNSNNNNTDKFWSDDIEILFKVDKLSHFFPSTGYSFSEKLNDITRCAFYLSILLYLYNGNYKFLFIFIVVLILTYMIFHNNEEYKTSRQLISKFTNFGNKRYPVEYISPTKNNPFMNISLDDYEKNPNRESIMRKNGSKKNINEQINKKFNINLYKDVSDIFGKENSQRQFYTTPITTIPNDQTKFAKWLYNIPKTCKEGNGQQCMRNNFNPLYGMLRGKTSGCPPNQ